jgi:hypothetical protein
VVGRDESSRRDGGSLVDNGRLDVALDGLDGRGVNDAAQGSDGIGAVDDVAADSSVLHDAAGDHDDILSRVGELLDDQIDHLTEGGILVLEQLGDAKEEGSSLILRKLLAGEEQQREFGEQDTTFARRDGR